MKRSNAAEIASTRIEHEVTRISTVLLRVQLEAHLERIPLHLGSTVNSIVTACICVVSAGHLLLQDNSGTWSRWRPGPAEGVCGWLLHLRQPKLYGSAPVGLPLPWPKPTSHGTSLRQAAAGRLSMKSMNAWCSECLLESYECLCNNSADMQVCLCARV